MHTGAKKEKQINKDARTVFQTNNFISSFHPRRWVLFAPISRLRKREAKAVLLKVSTRASLSHLRGEGRVLL